MQLVKTTVRYYTNEEDTNTRSGQMDNPIVRKNCKEKLLIKFNKFNTNLNKK
jgi:hypothetical protein